MNHNISDIEKAKSLLAAGDFTCVLCRGEVTHTSTLPGIAPMMKFIKTEANLSGFSAADKIVGRAAAFLFVLAGIREVYAQVMSEGAAAVLEKHGIAYTAEKLVVHIINRAGDGVCPMEAAVGEINDPRIAFEVLSAKIADKI